MRLRNSNRGETVGHCKKSFNSYCLLDWDKALAVFDKQSQLKHQLGSFFKNGSYIRFRFREEGFMALLKISSHLFLQMHPKLLN